jgi:hypothetical protein
MKFNIICFLYLSIKFFILFFLSNTIKFIAKIFTEYIIEVGIGFNNDSENKRNDKSKSSKEISIEYINNVI